MAQQAKRYAEHQRYQYTASPSQASPEWVYLTAGLPVLPLKWAYVYRGAAELAVWSKDIILVFTDGHNDGLQAWLHTYHAYKAQGPLLPLARESACS